MCVNRRQEINLESSKQANHAYINVRGIPYPGSDVSNLEAIKTLTLLKVRKATLLITKSGTCL